MSTARAPKDPKWLTGEIVRLSRRKKRAWNTYTQHFGAENRVKYEEISKELIKKKETQKEIKKKNWQTQRIIMRKGSRPT